MPGAPQISGTDEDSQHFYHQPPPVAGINFGSQPDAIDHAASNDSILRPPEELRPDSMDQSRWHRRHSRHHRDDHDETGDDTDTPDSFVAGSPVLSPVPQGSPVRNGSPHAMPQPDTPRRAHFPSEPDELTKTYSAPRRAQTGLSHMDGADPGSAGGVAYDGEKDREPAAHRGPWQSFRNWLARWKADLGSPDQAQDLQDLIGDVGIDLQTIRKVTGRGKGKGRGNKGKQHHSHVASLIAPSVMLARPGLGTRTESAASIRTIPSGSTTAMNSGTTTPGTLKKLFGSGVDPHELTGALRKLKSRAAKGDSKQAKYVQAKAELAHRRNVVLLMVRFLLVYFLFSLGMAGQRLQA